jgi:hypothetical protein
MPDPFQVQDGFFATTNTKLASALCGLGFVLKQDFPTVNVYTKETPPAAGNVKPGDPLWRPGEVTWRLEDTSKVYCIKIQDVLRAWEFGKSVDDIEKLIQDLIRVNGESAENEPIRKQEVARLGTAILQMLPCAYMVAMKTGFENRERLAKIVRDPTAREFALKRRGSGFTVVDRKLSQELKDQLQR